MGERKRENERKRGRVRRRKRERERERERERKKERKKKREKERKRERKKERKKEREKGTEGELLIPPPHHPRPPRRARSLSPGLPYRLARNEFKIMQKLQSPFICKVVVAITTNEGHLGIIEAVLGGELAQMMKKTKGRFPDSTVAFYVCQMCFALIHIHEAGVIYRDLKAENVLIATDGYIKLIDFGLAKETGTLTKTLCGTPVSVDSFLL